MLYMYTKLNSPDQSDYNTLAFSHILIRKILCSNPSDHKIPTHPVHIPASASTCIGRVPVIWAIFSTSL